VNALSLEKINKLETENIVLREKVGELKTQNDELKTQNDELKTQNDELKDDNEYVYERIEDLKVEKRSLMRANERLAFDLHLDYSELVWIKSQLLVLEAHCLPPEDPDFSYVHVIERLHLDWRDVEKRFAIRKELGATLTTESLKTTLAKEYLESIRVSRLGTPAYTSMGLMDLDSVEDILEREARSSTQASSTIRARSVDSTSSESIPEVAEVLESHEEEHEQEDEEEQPTTRIGFWDALARAAGIIDYYELFADDDDDDTED
jgi:hypothetical protein